ncbi:hypothetical protein [Gemmatimonas sp.]|uniref:hypothetical protein n=1 Tax=Gemmatimonas sp. TaxID=1962908 RepID=UPI003DA1DE16
MKSTIRARPSPVSGCDTLSASSSATFGTTGGLAATLKARAVSVVKAVSHREAPNGAAMPTPSSTSDAMRRCQCGAVVTERNRAPRHLPMT